MVPGAPSWTRLLGIWSFFVFKKGGLKLFFLVTQSDNLRHFAFAAVGFLSSGV